MHKYLPSWLFCRENRNKTSSGASSSVSLSHSGDQEDLEVERLVTHIITLHTELSSLPDLRPCDEINKLFEELVVLCTRTVGETVASKVR
jgi:nicotianamine synthase